MRRIRTRPCTRPWASGPSPASAATCSTANPRPDNGGHMTDTKELFEEARTNSVWQERPVADDLLRRGYDIAKKGATSGKSCPMGVVCVKAAEAKERLKPCLNEGNVEKTMKAPATAIIVYDTRFYDLLPRLFPARDMRTGYANDPELAHATAFRNGSLQGGYFIIAE